MRRWSLLTPCVTAVIRTSANLSAAVFVATVIVDPVVVVAGAVLTTGRTRGVPSALRRYGGEKICPSGRIRVHLPPPSPPPAEKTPPSRNQRAAQHYYRKREHRPALEVLPP